jgi:hypothetical protein
VKNTVIKTRPEKPASDECKSKYPTGKREKDVREMHSCFCGIEGLCVRQCGEGNDKPPKVDAATAPVQSVT